MAFQREGLFVLFIAASFLLLSGCLQSSQPDRCTTFSNLVEKDACYNHFAVWYQDPYQCYSIQNIDLRASCLDDSNNVEAQRRLIETQSNPGLQQVPSVTAPPTPIPGANGSAPTAAPGSAESKIADCMVVQKLGPEPCEREVAINTLNMTLCAQLVAGDLRASCISNVALTSKNPALCAALNRTADVQICKYYASGG